MLESTEGPCGCMCRQESNWFSVRVGLHRNRIVSVLLFKVFINEVIREV